MSRFRIDDDLFSPVRLDATVSENSDSAEESQNDHSTVDDFFLTNAARNTVTLEKSVIKFAQENELKYQDSNCPNTSLSNFNNSSGDKSESLAICTPILIQNSSDSLTPKKHLSKVKLTKSKDYKSAILAKENSERQQKKQNKLLRENILDSSTVKSDPSDKLQQKKSRPTSLLLRNESTKQDSLKDIKKKQKIAKQSLKDSYGDGMQKSIFKVPAGKKISSCSSHSLENSNIKFEDSSVMSAESRESKENTSSNILENGKHSNITLEIEELDVNFLSTPYEDIIKKMIHNAISAEWTKIRQLMYMQQMHFYREMNKMKDEIEKKHLATTQHLYKVIEELMQMNVSLRELSNK